jgi:hypothetical protein
LGSVATTASGPIDRRASRPAIGAPATSNRGKEPSMKRIVGLVAAFAAGMLVSAAAARAKAETQPTPSSV